MKHTIWMVEGQTGEYSDHCEWPVAFYYDEELAKRHVELASARQREISEKLRIDYENSVCGHFCKDEAQDYCEVHKHIKNEWDEKMRCDYTGTNYRCYKVHLGAVR